MQDVQDMLPLFDVESQTPGVCDSHDARKPGVDASYAIDIDRCMHCGDCVRACLFGAIAAGPMGRTLRILEDRCTACGACHEACPTGAVYERRER
ncbi:4Fe-4S dicluster domain-containing protein [Enorma massiliensis]|uniref:4Fe-4S dicluster domain-containing protein n=1 Tax=Enorma massiliensis TaxID=1472761 RepID=UPI003A8E0C8F